MTTLKAELWEVEERASNSWEIKGHGLEKCELILRSSRYTAGKYIAEKETMELIAQAVNACKAINPDNPISAAKVIVKMYDVLMNIATWEGGYSEWQNINDEQLKKIVSVLKQATE